MKKTARLHAPPITLLRGSIGPLAGVPGKLRRLGRALAAYGRGHEIERRISVLKRRGIIDVEPSLLQIVVGGIDMLRFFISPAAADYYRERNINYAFHQLLRFCDDPASLTDPVGLLSEQSVIIGHLLQVVHANPVYDLQLLAMYDDGLDQLEAELEAMLRGDHPRAGSIGAIVEEPDYHARLLAFVRIFRRDPSARPLRRSNVEASPELLALDGVFGTLDAAARYFSSLPRDGWSAALHLARATRPIAPGAPNTKLPGDRAAS